MRHRVGYGFTSRAAASSAAASGAASDLMVTGGWLGWRPGLRASPFPFFLSLFVFISRKLLWVLDLPSHEVANSYPFVELNPI